MAGRHSQNPRAITHSSSSTGLRRVKKRRLASTAEKWLRVAGSFCLLVIFGNVLLLHNRLVASSSSSFPSVTSTNDNDYRFGSDLSKSSPFSLLSQQHIAPNNQTFSGRQPYHKQHRRVTENPQFQPSILVDKLQRLLEEYKNLCPTKGDHLNHNNSAFLRGNRPPLSDPTNGFASKSRDDKNCTTTLWEELQRERQLFPANNKDNLISTKDQDPPARAWVPPSHCQQLLARRQPLPPNNDQQYHAIPENNHQINQRHTIHDISSGQSKKNPNPNPNQTHYPAAFIMLWTDDPRKTLRGLFLQIIHLVEDGTPRVWEKTSTQHTKKKKTSKNNERLVTSLTTTKNASTRHVLEPNHSNDSNSFVPPPRLVPHRIWLLLAPSDSSHPPPDSNTNTATRPEGDETAWEILAKDTNYGHRLLAWHHQPHHPLRIVVQPPSTTLLSDSTSSFSFWDAMEQLLILQQEDDFVQPDMPHSTLPWVWIHGHLRHHGRRAGTIPYEHNFLSKGPSLTHKLGQQWETMLQKQHEQELISPSSLSPAMIVNTDTASSTPSIVNSTTTYLSCPGKEMSMLPSLNFFQRSLWTDSSSLCLLQHPSMAFVRNLTRHDWQAASYAALMWLTWLTPQRYLWAEEDATHGRPTNRQNDSVLTTRKLEQSPPWMSQLHCFFRGLPSFEQLMESSE